MKDRKAAPNQPSELEKWLARIEECRSSGKSVRAWCEEQDIPLQTYYRWKKRCTEMLSEQKSAPTTEESGQIVQVNPDTLPTDEGDNFETAVVIHHGESVITFPTGIQLEAVAELVKALNRHV